MAKHYPKRSPAWCRAAAVVLMDAENRCQACGAEHLSLIFRSAAGRISKPSEDDLVSAHPGQFTVVNVEAIPIDGNFGNIAPSNLIALCLACQARLRHRRRSATLRALQTSLSLPDATDQA